MKVKILNKQQLEKISSKPFVERTAIISIADYDKKFPILQNQPTYLYQVRFNDIEESDIDNKLVSNVTGLKQDLVEDKYHMIKDLDAKNIADFYFNVYKKIDCLIIQCEHGISRSSAVAAAILEFHSKSGIIIFASDKYFPNKLVYRKVILALRNKKNNI